MKTLQGRFKVFTLLAVLLVILVGCNQETPVSALNDNPVPERATAISASGKTIQFLAFADTRAATLSKSTTVQKYISRPNGGYLYLYQNHGGIEAEFRLDVLPGAIDFSKTISMTFDDENYEGFTDIVFGPHGTQFSIPALLDVNVQGLDLTGINPNNVKLYYVNDNGLWEEMVAASIMVNVNDNNVEIIDAQLPHFSRYAIGAD